MQEIDPKQTPRAEAFTAWMQAPMPMVTLIKTLDVTRLVRVGRRQGYQFNMLFCWCIGKAAAQDEAFLLLPVKDKMIRYDRLAISTVVKTQNGGISTCDIPFSPDLAHFDRDYRSLTQQVQRTGQPYDRSADCMVIGTSALAEYEIDGAVNLYAGVFNNPFLIWGRYRSRWMKKTLPVSFQFHHTQMDGIPAAAFLERLQQQIKTVC